MPEYLIAISFRCAIASGTRTVKGCSKHDLAGQHSGAVFGLIEDRRRQACLFRVACWSELKPPRNLDSPRRTDVLIPATKTGSGNVVVESEIRALVVDVVGIVQRELVQVKRVEEGEAKLEIHPFRDPRILGDGEVDILAVGTSQI